MSHAFRYPLASSLKKHQWEQQALRQELATARAGSARLAQEQEAIAQGMQALNAQLARMHAGAFDPLQRERLVHWRDVQDSLLAAKQREVADAQESLQRISEHLARCSNGVRGHESYRDRLAGEHRVESERLEWRRMDDAWLLRGSGLEDAP